MLHSCQEPNLNLSKVYLFFFFNLTTHSEAQNSLLARIRALSSHIEFIASILDCSQKKTIIVDNTTQLDNDRGKLAGWCTLFFIWMCYPEKCTTETRCLYESVVLDLYWAFWSNAFSAYMLVGVYCLRIVFHRMALKYILRTGNATAQSCARAEGVCAREANCSYMLGTDCICALTLMFATGQTSHKARCRNATKLFGNRSFSTSCQMHCVCVVLYLYIYICFGVHVKLIYDY